MGLRRLQKRQLEPVKVKLKALAAALTDDAPLDN